ncbi:unnamed protein product, partial [Laminaria digitata]
HCKKRYAAASLDKGHASKLKCAMMEQLGKLDEWDGVEKRGNPVASPIVRGHLSFVQGEQRRVGVGVRQAPPLVAVQLRDLVRDMRRRGQTLPTAAERIAMIRDVAIFCLAFHSMKRGFELSAAVASQVLQMSEGEEFIFNFLFGKTLRSSSQAVVVRRNLDCRCAVAAMGSGFLFPSVVESVERGDLALTPAQMTTNLQTHLRAAGMEGKRYTMHFFRVGGAASHNVVGTAMDVLMEYLGWKSATTARRYVGITASAAVAGA